MTSTVVVSIGAIVLLLCLLGGSAVALLTYASKFFAPRNDVNDSMEVRMAALELRMDSLPPLWKEERDRAKRSADAARKARTDAENKLEEVQELIEANLAVPDVDEAHGDQREMFPVPTRLGDPTPSDRRARVQAVAHLMR